MDTDNLQKWALIAEIFGGLAIVVSLIFVGIQVNQSSIATDQNTKALEGDAYQNLISQITTMNMAIIQDSEFADIYNRMLSGEDPKNATEDRRVNVFITMNVRHGDIAYRQYSNGFIDEDSLNSVLAPVIIFIKNMSPGKSRWEAMRSVLSPDYVEYVNKKLKD